MTIYIIRASHANEFELQNYAPLAKKLDIKIVTSRHPLTPISIPTIKLWSPTDLPYFPFRRQLLNRLIGGEQWLIGLEKTIKKGSIVHTAETYTPYTHQVVQLKKLGYIKKLICTCWETIPHNNEKFLKLKDWKKEAYKYVDLFHVPTTLAQKALIQEGISKDKILVIPYGVDTDRFKPSKKKIANERLKILTVARLEKEKGVEKIEEAARRLPGCDFIVLGRGRYHFHESNITVRSVPYKDIHKEYQAADIFFFPSLTTATWEEQYGMALVEARACGLPIVAGNSGAIKEVLDLDPEIIKIDKVAARLSKLYT